MLTPVPDSGPSPLLPAGGPARIVAVAAEYNRVFVDGMLEAAAEWLQKAGNPLEHVIRVPGSYEIPVVVGRLLDESLPLAKRPDAILCLGLIWQGKTRHADLIADAVTRSLMDLQVRSGVPCVHEILVVTDPDQARERCLDPATNRGGEAARTALRMVQVLRGLDGSGPAE